MLEKDYLEHVSKMPNYDNATYAKGFFTINNSYHFFSRFADTAIISKKLPQMSGLALFITSAAMLYLHYNKR